MTGIERIAAERKRQIAQEGWTPENDNKYVDSQLVRAAVCYALPRENRTGIWTILWPWGAGFWKPSPDNRIRELEKAGALIAAEIDRLQRIDSFKSEKV